MSVALARAKSEYFLTTADLQALPCQRWGGGIGCGAPRKFYNAADLEAAALRKYGEAGLRNKKEAQLKRESKKRQREEAANEALASLAPPAVNAFSTLMGSSAAATTAALRKSLLKLSKKALGFEQGGGPKDWRVEVPGVMPATFAALAGRPTDAALRTFAKAGAYHSHEIDACELYGCRESEMHRVFKREGVGLQIDDRVLLKYKPSDMTLTLRGGCDITVDDRSAPGPLPPGLPSCFYNAATGGF